MVVSLKQSLSTNLVLKIRLQNTLPHEIETYLARLPWENRDSMYLILVKESVIPEPPLKTRLVIDDPSPGRVILGPSQVLEGEVDLSVRFPELYEILKKQNVMLFWSYRFEPIRKHPLERMGGFLLLRRTT